jgi:VWFA-related protein
VKKSLLLTFNLLFIFGLLASPDRATTQTSQSAQQQKKSYEQEQTIKLTTDLIEVRAVVTDKNSKLVTNLKQEDFELLENNRPQVVSFFSVTRIPDKENDEVANRPANTPAPATALAAAPTRTVVLPADTLHLSAGSLLRLKPMLRRFIDEKLTEQDLTGLVTSQGSLGIGGQFTRDRRLLRQPGQIAGLRARRLRIARAVEDGATEEAGD